MYCYEASTPTSEIFSRVAQGGESKLVAALITLEETEYLDPTSPAVKGRLPKPRMPNLPENYSARRYDLSLIENAVERDFNNLENQLSRQRKSSAFIKCFLWECRHNSAQLHLTNSHECL